jgi:hypothetical protein
LNSSCLWRLYRRPVWGCSFYDSSSEMCTVLVPLFLSNWFGSVYKCLNFHRKEFKGYIWPHAKTIQNLSYHHSSQFISVFISKSHGTLDRDEYLYCAATLSFPQKLCVGLHLIRNVFCTAHHETAWWSP